MNPLIHGGADRRMHEPELLLAVHIQVEFRPRRGVEPA
jgi:hypothetical protein